MSVLCVDIGNAHTVLGLTDIDAEVKKPVADDVGFGSQWRVSTEERRSGDEWAVLVSGLLAQSPGPVSRVDELEGIVVCATVPGALHEWRMMLDRHFAGVPSLIVEPGVRTGIGVQTENPREVGTDRVMSALAASTIATPVIVVDFAGTATSYNVVDDQGRFVGGAITPGMELSLEALSRRGAQLRHVEIARPPRAIARNTTEAMQSGLVFGMAAQVDGLVSRMIEELVENAEAEPAPVCVLGTGYLAELVADECASLTETRPWLTLIGLAMVFHRSKSHLRDSE